MLGGTEEHRGALGSSSWGHLSAAAQRKAGILAFWHFAALHFIFTCREAAPGEGETQQCLALLASVYLVKTNLSSLPMLRFLAAPCSSQPEGWSWGLIVDFPFPHSCWESRRNLASSSTRSHIHQGWVNTANCSSPAEGTGGSTGAPTRVTAAGKHRQGHWEGLADPRPCLGDGKRCPGPVSEQHLSPPGATGATLALTEMRPECEHKAAAQGNPAQPASLCLTALLGR